VAESEKRHIYDKLKTNLCRILIVYSVGLLKTADPYVIRRKAAMAMSPSLLSEAPAGANNHSPHHMTRFTYLHYRPSTRFCITD